MVQVGTTSSWNDSSGGPWRSLRITQACIFSGTWPSGGISPMSYKSFNGAILRAGAAAGICISFGQRNVPAVCRNAYCGATSTFDDAKKAAAGPGHRGHVRPAADFGEN